MLTITRGDDYTGARHLVVTIHESDAADAALLDLTGLDLRFMVKKLRTDTNAAALIDKSTADAITLGSPQSGATLGLAYIALDDIDTAIQPGAWYWELQGTDADGVVTLGRGRFIVTPDLVLA